MTDRITAAVPGCRERPWQRECRLARPGPSRFAALVILPLNESTCVESSVRPCHETPGREKTQRGNCEKNVCGGCSVAVSRCFRRGKRGRRASSSCLLPPAFRQSLLPLGQAENGAFAVKPCRDRGASGEPTSSTKSTLSASASRCDSRRPGTADLRGGVSQVTTRLHRRRAERAGRQRQVSVGRLAPIAHALMPIPRVGGKRWGSVIVFRIVIAEYLAAEVAWN